MNMPTIRHDDDDITGPRLSTLVTHADDVAYWRTRCIEMSIIAIIFAITAIWLAVKLWGVKL